MKPLICQEGHERHYVPCTNRSNTKLYCSHFVNGVQSDASEPTMSVRLLGTGIAQLACLGWFKIIILYYHILIIYYIIIYYNNIIIYFKIYIIIYFKISRFPRISGWVGEQK